MIQKTYGTKDLKDWTVNIKSGNASLRVNFEGGAATVRGIIPATYTTADPVKQAIIEKSEYFKHGRIYVEQQIEVPDDAEAIARKIRNARIAKRTTASEGNGTVDKPQDVDGQQGKVEDTPDSKDAGGSATIESVKVADKSEAVEWLKEHYPEEGYTAVKLRTMAAVNEAGKKHNVVFEVSAE